MKIGRVQVCDSCGAAFTAHTRDCPRAAEPAPMAALPLPAAASAAVEGSAAPAPALSAEELVATFTREMSTRFDGRKVTAEVVNQIAAALALFLDRLTACVARSATMARQSVRFSPSDVVWLDAGGEW